jgi:hypothetical protein
MFKFILILFISEKNLTLQIEKQLKVPLSVTVEAETLQTLDKLREEVPRSRYVERALKQCFERELAARMAAGNASRKG